MQKKVKLGEIGQLKNGLNFAKKDVKNKCKIIGVADFANNIFPEYGLLDAIDESLVSDDFLLKDGDIIFVRSNGNKALVGRTMFIENICEKICYSGFCIRFRPDIDKVNPQYLFYLLRSPMVRKQYSYSQQTNITNLSQDVLSGVTLFLPDIEIQNKQAKILHDLDMKILSNTMINDNLPYQSWMVA